MLYLIQRNRLGKNIVNTEDKPVNWRELFKPSEDSLTSSIFSLLFYLPVEMFWQIFRKSCYGAALPMHSGKILSYEFWPHWKSTDTANSYFVEPDVFIRFEAFDLIIEAKRYDHIEQQKEWQWAAEIQAYNNEYVGENRKQLFFIALAGMQNIDRSLEPVDNTPVIACRWGNILQLVKLYMEGIKLLGHTLNSVDSILNILGDIVRAFAIHGFSTAPLLGCMPTGYSINYKNEIPI